MARAPHARRPGRRPAHRGAALLSATVFIAILTALAVDLAYENRVRLQLAVNARDALRAEALAEGGVALARLVLAFQQQLDETTGKACGALGQVPGAAAALGGGCPRPQIWNLVPVSSGLVQALFGGGESAAGAPLPEGMVPAAVFGDFEGAFEARIEDEGAKVNAQLDELAVNGALGVQVEAFLRLVCDPAYDDLFDRQDADGQRYTRGDLVVHLRDWIDERSEASTLQAAFPGGGNCNFLLPLTAPFEQGFSDENYPYDRGPDRYRTKNARFDSLEELHLVAGVTDDFMAQFADQLTVYLPREKGSNVNTSDPEQQLRIAWQMAQPEARPLLADPTFAERLAIALAEVRRGGLFAIGQAQFAAVVQALGVPVQQQYLQGGDRGPFSDRSLVFRVRSAGGVGAVTRTIDAVVTFDPRQLQGDPVAGKPLPGRLIRWRVE